MKTKLTTIFLALLMLPPIVAGAREASVVSGGLKAVVASLAESDTELILTGTAGVSDLMALRGLPASVVTLRMDGLTIAPSTLAAPIEGKFSYDAGELPPYLFFQSGLHDVSLPSNTRAIPEGLFASSSVENVEMPSSVAHVGAYAFLKSNLRRFLAPSGLKSVGKMAFADCRQLTEASFGRGVDFCGEEIFSRSSIEELDLSGASRYGDYSLAAIQTITDISLNPQAEYGVGVLAACPALLHVKGAPADVPDLFATLSTWVKLNEMLPSSTSVGAYAFAASGSGGIVLGKDVRFLSEGAFAGFRHLTLIDVNSLGTTLPDADESSIAPLTPEEIELYVAPESEPAWAAHPFWGRFRIKSGPSVVDQMQASRGVRISSANGVVTVTSDTPLGQVELFSLDGRLLYTLSTHETEVSVDASRWAGQPVVVCAGGISLTIMAGK